MAEAGGSWKISLDQATVWAGGDDALVAKAAAASQIETARERAEVGNGFRRGHCEAALEVGQEGCEDAIGVFQSANIGQAGFADEAVLEGAPETFDAAGKPGDGNM